MRSSTPSYPKQKVLVADDDLVSRTLVEATLQDLGYHVLVASDGTEALAMLQQQDAPRLAILDWEMPGISGLDVCHEVRAKQHAPATYLILLTQRQGASNVVAGLRSGANDYITKPFNREELAARMAVAASFIAMQQALSDRVSELELALSQIKTLRALLPICAWCKKIRDDGDYWHEVEEYVALHANVRFTHGICPGCESTLDEEAERLSMTPCSHDS
jgi:phosphoserine phosphatase RsbU/P